MAKIGLDYFPLNCQLDEKIELIEAEFGPVGFSIVVKLLQRIYGEHGYYCEWTNEVALLFSKRVGLGGNVVSEIVEASVRRGIFSEELFEKYNVLSSRGIQRRYLDAASRRKEVLMKSEYLLIKVDQKYRNVNITDEDVDISVKNVGISNQSKVKESRVKESKAKKKESVLYAPHNSKLNKAILDFIDFRKKNKSAMTDRAIELLINKLNKESKNPDVQIEMLEQSIMNGWKSVYPLKNDRNKSGTNNKFNQFSQREYSEKDYEDLEWKLLNRL